MDIEIVQISYGSAEWKALIDFSRVCSWKGTGQCIFMYCQP